MIDSKRKSKRKTKKPKAMQEPLKGMNTPVAQPPIDIVIARFGAAHGTVTVWILEKDIVKKTQDTLNEKEKSGELLRNISTSPGHLVCFKLHDQWRRAAVLRVDANRQTAELSLLDSGRIVRHCPLDLLFRLPRTLRNGYARPYLIESFEPKPRSVFGYKSVKDIGPFNVAAAAFLNAELKSTMQAKLLRTFSSGEYPSYLDVASVTIESNMKLSFYVLRVLQVNDIVLNGRKIVTETPFDSVKWYQHTVDSFCPTEREICEVLAIDQSEQGYRLALGVGEAGDVLFMQRGPGHRYKDHHSVNTAEVDRLIGIYKGDTFERALIVAPGEAYCFDSGRTLKLDGPMEIVALLKSFIKMLPNMCILVDTESLLDSSGKEILEGDMLTLGGLKKIEGLRFSYGSLNLLPAETFVTGLSATAYEKEFPRMDGRNETAMVAEGPRTSGGGTAWEERLCDEFGELAAIQNLQVLRLDGEDTAICTLGELSQMISTVVGGIQNLRNIRDEDVRMNLVTLHVEGEDRDRAMIISDEVCDGLVPIKLMDRHEYKCVPLSKLFHLDEDLLREVPDFHVKVKLVDTNKEAVDGSCWFALWDYDGRSFKGKLLEDYQSFCRSF